MTKENEVSTEPGIVQIIKAKIELHSGDSVERQAFKDAADLARFSAIKTRLRGDVAIRQNEAAIAEVNGRIDIGSENAGYKDALRDGEGLITAYAETIRFRSPAIANHELVAANSFKIMLRY